MGLETAQHNIEETTPNEERQTGELHSLKLKTPEKNLSDADRKAIDRGEKSTEQVDIESTYVEERAKKLLSFAKKEKKLSSRQAEEYEQQLSQTGNREDREQILLEIQKQIATIKTDKDRSAALEKNDPERENLRRNYKAILKEHAHLFGSAAMEEYEKWFDQQTPTIENLEKQTIALLQSEIPVRRILFDKLKDKLRTYGIQNPTEVPFIAREGKSEREQFLKNIEILEAHFQNYRGIREKLYSKKAEQTLMQEICRAETLQAQAHMCQRPKFLESREHNSYAELERAVRSGKISQKSMDNMLAYYKDLTDWTKRADNLNLWDGFVEAEAKLEKDLEKVFEEEPANKQGFEIARKTFRDKDFVEKQEFIAQTKHLRETERTKEAQNRTLLIQNFKHEIEKACANKVISPKTAERYKDWIDKEAEGKTSEEIKKFLDILTSPIANKEAKNLKAYEEQKKIFLADLKKLQELKPGLSKEDIDKWKDEYDELGWEKREKKHEELLKEIDKEKLLRSKAKLDRKDEETLKEAESKEALPLAERNKETALEAIEELKANKLYGSALAVCTELRINNPEDKKVLELYKELKDLANGLSALPKAKEVTKKQLENDTEIKDEADELQAEAIAYDLMEENQQRHENLTSAKDRAKKAVDHKTAGRESLKRINEEYLKESDKTQTLDEKNLKGRKVIQVKTDTTISRAEAKTLRKNIQKEQDKRDHGGSSAIEFTSIKSGKKLERRQAKLEHESRRSALAEEMAEKTAKALSPEKEATPDEIIEARKEALEQLKEKEETRIERMAA